MNNRPKVTVAALQSKKRKNQKITLLTAYDFYWMGFLSITLPLNGPAFETASIKT
jgi:hypothetical protein